MIKDITLNVDTPPCNCYEESQTNDWLAIYSWGFDAERSLLLECKVCKRIVKTPYSSLRASISIKSFKKFVVQQTQQNNVTDNDVIKNVIDFVAFKDKRSCNKKDPQNCA